MSSPLERLQEVKENLEDAALMREAAQQLLEKAGKLEAHAQAERAAVASLVGTQTVELFMKDPLEKPVQKKRVIGLVLAPQLSPWDLLQDTSWLTGNRSFTGDFYPGGRPESK